MVYRMVRATKKTEEMSMEASAWCNGKTIYGIRVGVHNRAKHFTPGWTRIEVEIGGQVHQFELTAGFWKKCPEFRDSGGTPIRDWLGQHHTIIWPKGKPPRFKLHALGGNRFRLGD